MDETSRSTARGSFARFAATYLLYSRAESASGMVARRGSIRAAIRNAFSAEGYSFALTRASPRVNVTVPARKDADASPDRRTRTAAAFERNDGISSRFPVADSGRDAHRIPSSRTSVKTTPNS